MFADRGYYKSEQILDCELAGIKTLVPKSHTSNNGAVELFDKADFRYIPSIKMSTAVPQANERSGASPRSNTDYTLHKYCSSACPRCAIKAKCTTGENRRIARWEHEVCPRQNAAATVSDSTGLTNTPPDRRASVCHDQGLDGSDALSHQDDSTREYRDDFACISLQYEMRDVYLRNCLASGGN